MMKCQGKQARIAAGIFLSLCMLTGCSSDGSEIERAERLIRDQMIDPESTVFHDSRVTEDGVVCGIVNSRNRMGGMAGKRLYYVNGNFSGIQPVRATKDFSDYYNMMCAQGAGSAAE